MFATGSIGMVSALVQTNPEAMNAELADQDLEAVDELDKELREEGINVRCTLSHNPFKNIHLNCHRLRKFTFLRILTYERHTFLTDDGTNVACDVGERDGPRWNDGG